MRTRSRWVSIVVAALMVASIVPAGAAVGATDSGGGAVVAATSTTVSTSAGPGGIKIRVKDLASDVVGLDFYRSTEAGVEGDKLNDEPVGGSRYFDETAQAEVQYYYTVKVAERGEAKRGSDAVTPDVLAQVVAEIVPAPPVRPEPKVSASAVRPERVTTSELRDPVAASAEQVAAMATTIGGSGPVTINVNTTWSPAKGPYYIRNDVVVAAGKTLTILPGTKVYFDTAASGTASSTPFAGVSSVTQRVDLVVHGKLIAKGTSSSPILFSSIRSTPASGAANLPAAGDWGTIFVDSMDASEVSYARVEYALVGIWGHRTSRPYVSNSTFRECGQSGWHFPYGMVSFTQPRTNTTTPRIRVTGNKMGSGSDVTGVSIYFEALGDSTADRVINPYIANNDITASYGIEMFMDESPQVVAHKGKFGNQFIKGTVANNRLVSDSGHPVWVGADSQGGKSASITTAFSGNTIVGSTYDSVYVEAYADGWGGTATVKPTFSKDVITAADYYMGANFYAESSDSSATSPGGATASPVFTACQVRSSGSDGVEAQAYAYGKGTASASPVFSGGSVQSRGGYCADLYAWSDKGSAVTSPRFTNFTGRAWNGNDALYAYAETANSGKALANPRFTGGSMWASEGAGMYLYAESDKGSAEAKPYLSGTSVWAYDSCVEAYAYGSDGGTGSGYANVSGTLYKAKLHSVDDYAYYGYADAGGTGNVTASPVMTGGSIKSDADNAFYLAAYSNRGSATSSPSMTDASLECEEEVIEVNVTRSGDSTFTGSATSSPKILRSKILSYDYDAIDITVTNQGVGNATSKPTITSSSVTNLYDDAGLVIDVQVDNTGTAEVSPVVSKSNFKAQYIPLDLYARGAGTKGKAKVGGTFTDSSFTSTWSQGVYAEAYNAGGATEVVPRFTRCNATAPDGYGYEFYAQNSGVNGTTAVCSPVISGGRVTSDYGIGIWASQQGSVTSPTTVKVAPRITNAPITSYSDYGIYTWAFTTGPGASTNDSYVYNSPVTSEDGIIHEAICQGASATGSATNRARTLGISASKRMRVEAFDDYGVYSYAYSQGGSAYDRTQTKYLSIHSADAAVYVYAQSGNVAGKVADVKPLIHGNSTALSWGNDDEIIYVEANAPHAVSTATASPTISSNSVVGGFDDVVNVYAWSGGKTVVSPRVTGNTITGGTGNGIYVYSGGADTGSAPYIAQNTVARSGYCNMYLNNITGGTVTQNRLSDPGWYYGDPDEWYTSNLVWVGADHSKAAVRGNMMVGARSTGVLYNAGAPKTTYNSFTDSKGNVNRPFNYWTEANATSTVTPYDARYNWWGSTSGSFIASTVNTKYYGGAKTDIVNYGSALPSRQPKVKKIAVKKTKTKVKFTITFDRPMDKGVKTLRFGRKSPYRTYAVKGSWNAAGTVFTGTRKRSGLPIGKTMYFSGAKDLPGNLMMSKSKGFKL